MAYLRFTLWISLLFYDLHFFGAQIAHGQRVTEQILENVQLLEKLPLNENFRLESSEKLIVKRNTDSLSSPQVFKFELNDAKEPDEETRKLIQMRARELQLKEKDIEVVNMTESKRSKRAAQKIKPQLIPFLITDAKEPDSATKELIRRSRAKELSLISNKEQSRQSRHKENSETTQKREPSSKQNRGKTFTSITSTNKEPLTQGRVKSVALTTQNTEHFKQGRVKSVALTTQDREPLRQGKVQSVSLTPADQDILRENKLNEGTLTSQNRKRTKKNSPRKRTRRYAQLTEPRYIKFELHDVKEPNNDNRAEVQILPRPSFGAKILNHQLPEPNTSHQYDDSDSSAQGSKYRYFLHEAPRKPHLFGPYPKRYEPNDLVFRVSKMQKYIASGQGLENINTNIEITLPPTATATAILSGYPKQIYGQKICPYGSQGCQVGPLAPAAVPHQPLHQEFQKPAQNLIAENEVIPEQHQQRYYYNIQTQPQPEVNQQFIPIAKPYQTVTQIVHVPVIEQQPVHQEPQVAQNLIDDGKLIPQNPPLKVAYLEPTYGYGQKLYPYTFAKNIQVKPPASVQNAIGSFDGSVKNQEELPNKINEQPSSQFNLLKNNQEFQELSALIGKSPMDQVHGLSYLLAKEMQRKKNSNSHQRPQDQTSPILFHPKENTSVTNSQSVQKQNFENPKIENNQVLPPFQPLRTKNSSPINNDVQKDLQPQANSEVSSNDGDSKGIGLSPNYNGIKNHNHINNYSPPKIYSQAEHDSPMEYASKYSFGYRVRDFESGNDFAHKQNRDADGVTRGQYHILMPDGRIQNVVYYADDTGFHADIL